MTESGGAVSRLPPGGRFGLQFLLYLTGAAGLIWAADLPRRLGAVQRFLAWSANGLAHLAGGTGHRQGDQILTPAYIIDVNYECTGMYVFVILLVFLGAYPASWRARAAGAAVGLTAFTLINVLRIAVLVRVAELRPELFAHFHEYVWQGAFLVMVIGYAMKWVEWAR